MKQAQAIRASMDAAAVVLTDAQAAAAPLLYRPWDGEGVAYAAGDRRLYGGSPTPPSSPRGSSQTAPTPT